MTPIVYPQDLNPATRTRRYPSGTRQPVRKPPRTPFSFAELTLDNRPILTLLFDGAVVFALIAALAAVALT